MIERLRRTRRQLAAGLVAVAVLALFALAAAQWPSYWRWIASEQTPMTWLQSVVLVLAVAIDSIDPSTWSLTAERLQQSLEEVGELAAGLCLLGAVVLRLLGLLTPTTPHVREPTHPPR